MKKYRVMFRMDPDLARLGGWDEGKALSSWHNSFHSVKGLYFGNWVMQLVSTNKDEFYSVLKAFRNLRGAVIIQEEVTDEEEVIDE